MNALRLNLFDIRKQRPAGRKKAIEIDVATINTEKEEDTEMTKTMKIEGMMCEHCEARVKKVLEAVDGVTGAQVSHQEGSAIVTMSAPVDDEILKKAVEDQDYKVLEIV